MHTDLYRTQYRKQFNQPKPFHNRTAKQSAGRLAKVQVTYEPMDMRTTGFGGNSQFAKGKKNLNYRRFEDNGR
jgi:hypothetical protein